MNRAAHDEQVLLALGRLWDQALRTAATARERELITVDRDLLLAALLHPRDTHDLVHIDLEKVRELLGQSHEDHGL